MLAINYMHQQNIMHRDIKPENILIAPEEATSRDIPNLKLTDFGFACNFEPEVGSKQVLGSPLYMAPEIVEEKRYGKAVDIWSIGVIAHILISGSPPFFGKSKQFIYESILKDTPRFGRVKQFLSEGAIDFVMRCLQKNPEFRASAEELLQDPWITGNAPYPVLDLETQTNIGSDLAAFRKQSVFQTGVVSLLTNLRVQASELRDLKQMFLNVDTSQDGFLSIAEIKAGMSNVFGCLQADSPDWVELIE